MYKFLILCSALLVVSCQPEGNIDPINNIEYGKGLYVLTENSVNYYDTKNNELNENIYQSTNGTSISNLNSINKHANSIYIVSENTLYSIDVNTFFKNWELNGFLNAQECEYAKFNRLYVSDKNDSEIKVIDTDLREITARIKTGNNTNPSDIILSYERAFVVNSGNQTFNEYDSSICAINIKDGLVPLNEFAGNIIVDKNPVSMCFNNGSVAVLCKGIYDELNISQNTSSSIHLIGAGSLNIQASNILNNLYDANNLKINNSNTKYYITSSSGVYYIGVNSLNHTLVTDKKIPTVLEINRESFANTDSTSMVVDFLYMNDKNNSDYIYKYNVYLDQFVDSFQVNSPVTDLKYFD